MSKVVWITGGGTGIGRSLSLFYAKEGAQVIISGRRMDRLESVKIEAERFSGSIIPIPCDVTDDLRIIEVIKEIESTYKHLDIVIANAGYAQTGRMENANVGDWHRQLNVNVIGAARCITHSLPLLRQTSGRIVLISSVMAYLRFPKSGLYSASKAMLVAYAQHFAHTPEALPYARLTLPLFR